MEAIPQELKDADKWICWRSEERDGDTTKVPINPRTGNYASSTDSDTWASFETAKAVHDRGDHDTDGLGFVFSPDDMFAGVDLDKCRDPDTGDIDDWAMDVIERLDSYTEVSPSGTGLHVIVKGVIPGKKNRKDGLEMYDNSRFFTMTGDHKPGTRTTVEARPEELKALYEEKLDDGMEEESFDAPESKSLDMDDSEILEKAINADNGDKFQRLWRGDTSDYNDDHSRADQALCNLLAFWTGGDPDRVQQMFERSGLMREKWRQREDYRKRTIQNAINNCSDFYEPGSNEDPEEAIKNGGGSKHEVRFKTDNFEGTMTNPKKKGDKIFAWIATKYTGDGGNDMDEPYKSKVNMSSRSVSAHAKTVCEVNDLDMSDNFEDLRLELKKEILRHKSDVVDLLQSKGQGGGSSGVGDPNTMVKDVIKFIYQHDGNPSLNAMEGEFPRFREIQEKYDDYIILQGDTVLLGEKGQMKAEELLGLDHYNSIEEVKAIAEDMLEEDPIGYFLDSIDNIHKGDTLLKIWEVVSALSARVSDRQIHSWAVGKSGKGKSHLKRQIIKYFPEEFYLKPNSLSPKALLYYADKEGTDVFKNKLIFFDEAEGYNDEDTVTLLRALTDQDEDLVTHMTVRDQNPETLILEKPMCVWFTSVQSMNDEQLKNRFILTNPDGSEDLDEEVLAHQQQRLHQGGSLGYMPKEVPVIKRMFDDILHNTDDLRAVAPFEIDWKQMFNRRLYPYFFTLMEIIAKIHYKNRKIEDGRIFITQGDFELAAKVWAALIDTTIAQTDKESLKLVEVLPEDRENAMNTSELAHELEGFSTHKVYRKFKHLQETEELNLVNGEKVKSRWLIWGGRDREKLIDPRPEILISEELVKDRLSKFFEEVDEEFVEYILETKTPFMTDESRQIDVDNIDVEPRENSGPDLIRKLKDLYPKDEPADYLDIQAEAADELGISEAKFNDLHEELLNAGDVYEPIKGRFSLNV